jgi:hypothetical protein
MSDLDLMVRDGERTASDFEARGFDPETAEAMAEVVRRAGGEPEPGSDSDAFAREYRRGVESVDLRNTIAEDGGDDDALFDIVSRFGI